MIEFDEWKKLDLRVGEIKSVKDHPNADKLFILEVDIGESRQLVAGIKGHYKKEELLGKKIVVFSNLNPTKLRGIESQGMLLAAVNNGKVVLLTVDRDIDIGSKVE